MTRATQKAWTRVARPQSPNVDDPTLWGAWPRKTESDYAADFSGNGRDMIQDGKVSRAMTLLGTEHLVSRLSMGQLRFASPGATPASCTLACWLDKRILPAATYYYFNFYESTGAAWGLRCESDGSLNIYDDLSNANSQRYVTATPNKLTFVVATFDSATLENRFYIDGVLSGSGEFSASALSAISARLGACGRGVTNRANSMIGGVINPQVFSEVKDQTWVTAEYLRGAKAIPFKTDWGHRADGLTVVAPVYPGDGPFKIPTGDAGDFRVVAETIAGRTYKVLECVANGHVFLDWDAFGVHGDERGYGSWSFWGWTPDADGNLIRFSVFNTLKAPGTSGNGYRLELRGTGSLAVIFEQGVGDKITGAYTRASWTHVHATRRYDSQWELFINGVSQGTATDATTVAARYCAIQMTTGCKVILSGPKGERAITKYLGVVSPNMD